uniref:Elongated pigment-dispersing hormone n=1 Tax=Carcinus maenas TaxID=6759 RepID=A0A7G8LRN5_CARMA|nr:elongated pigment-dispersing hormone precursor [Carcinus maenas]
MTSVLRVMVVVMVVAILTTTVISHPTWIGDIANKEEDGEVRLMPVMMVAVPHLRSAHHTQPRPDQAHKRNSELLNTLLGSQDLGNMRNAGRR